MNYSTVEMDNEIGEFINIKSEILEQENNYNMSYEPYEESFASVFIKEEYPDPSKIDFNYDNNNDWFPIESKCIATLEEEDTIYSCLDSYAKTDVTNYTYFENPLDDHFIFKDEYNFSLLEKIFQLKEAKVVLERLPNDVTLDFAKEEKRTLVLWFERFCAICGKTTKGTKIDITCEECNKEMECRCLYCKFECNRYNKITSHLIRTCKADSGTQVCPKCNKAFYYKSKMKQHFRSCKPNKYSCDVCPYETALSASFYRHKKIHEKPERKKDYFIQKYSNRYCSHCDKTISSSKLRHPRKCKICNNALLFQCIKCSQKYSEYARMVKHIKEKCYLEEVVKSPSQH